MDSAEQNTSDTPEQTPANTDPLLISQSQSLHRLKDRIEQASHELNRLREENTKLHNRLNELEQANVYHGTSVQLEDDPDAVKKRIEGFIDVIDQYLDNDPKSPA